ncbi:unnamed protein product, partial [Ceratitis capitata]
TYFHQKKQKRKTRLTNRPPITGDPAFSSFFHMVTLVMEVMALVPPALNNTATTTTANE